MKYLAIYSILIGLSFSLISFFIIPKIEFAIQGTAVAFYEDISKEKKYLTTVGFKSYAPYFYSEVDHLNKVDKLYQKKSDILKKYFSSSSLNDLNRLQKNKFNVFLQQIFQLSFFPSVLPAAAFQSADRYKSDAHSAPVKIC